MVIALNAIINFGIEQWSIFQDRQAYRSSAVEQVDEFVCNRESDIPCNEQFEIWEREHPDQ